VLADARVGAFLLHGAEVGGLEIDNAFFVAGLLRLENVFSGGVKGIGLLLSDSLHD
jgi:hypothetical protein